MSRSVGAYEWVIPEGYLPEWSVGPEPEMTSHGTICVLNAGERDAHLMITVYFSDREPSGPYRETVPARRTKHLRFDEFNDPAPIATGVDFASVIESDEPVVVQYTRLDSRQEANALMSTMAYPAARV